MNAKQPTNAKSVKRVNFMSAGIVAEEILRDRITEMEASHGFAGIRGWQYDE